MCVTNSDYPFRQGETETEQNAYRLRRLYASLGSGRTESVQGGQDMRPMKRHGWEIVQLPDGSYQWILR